MTGVNWDKTTEFSGPEESPGFLLWKVSMRWRRQIEAALSTVGLTHPQFVLLANVGWLTRNGDDITQADLSRQCETDVNMTSQVLRALEKRGLIKRHTLKYDERSKYPKLTQEGSKLVETAIPLVEKVDREFFSKEGTHELLDRCCK